jgi:hypothetical protein
VLRRHLQRHGLTPDEYRTRWKLPRDYPTVAPAYSERRSATAKQIGLGRRRQTPDETAEPTTQAGVVAEAGSILLSSLRCRFERGAADRSPRRRHNRRYWRQVTPRGRMTAGTAGHWPALQNSRGRVSYDGPGHCRKTAVRCQAAGVSD